MEKKEFKKFDLEAAKAGKPVCTRDGRKARIICFDKKGDGYPILALVEAGGGESLFQYTEDGMYLTCSDGDDRDLIMAPEKHEGWVNIYETRGKRFSGEIYDTEKEAENGKGAAGYITTIKIEWEEQTNLPRHYGVGDKIRTSMDIRERVITTVAGISWDKEVIVSEDTCLREELDFDSLDLVELGIMLEREFGIELQDEDLDRLRTVSDVMKLMESKLENKWER